MPGSLTGSATATANGGHVLQGDRPETLNFHSLIAVEEGLGSEAAEVFINTE